MPSPLQKVATGLLGALELKTLGRNPNQFADQVVPTLDVSDFYLLSQLDALNFDNAAAVARGDLAAATVPNGECWRVLGVQARLQMPVGALTADPLGLSVVVAPFGIASAAQETRIASKNFGVIAALTAVTNFCVGERIQPLLLPPGADVWAILETDLSAASALRVGVLIQRFPS